MVSRTAEYCLRAVIYLADAEGGSRTTCEIAAATRIPASYLSKILHLLHRSGIVNARRGVKGGFALATTARSLSLLQLVRVVDPSQRVVTCPLGIHGTDLCPLHRQLDEAAAGADEVLARSTIAEICNLSREHSARGEWGL